MDNPYSILFETVQIDPLCTRQHALYDALNATNTSLETLELIGDANQPGLIADAVYSRHMAARHFEADPQEIDANWFRRELPALSHS